MTAAERPDLLRPTFLCDCPTCERIRVALAENDELAGNAE